MALHLADKWVWDFWFAQEGPDTHIFYLQADRALRDEHLRHWHVSVGHAVSQDLRVWEILPDALHPSSTVSKIEAFDSFTTWTGSIIPHQGQWYMFYTGSKHSEKGLIQRIGLATSDDLIKWCKHPENPLIVADPQWYELLDLKSWHDHAWRDPFVFSHPETGMFHALITARAKDGIPDARGVIGHAQSSDLIHWDVLPPVTSPGEFGHLEVPQLVAIQNRYYLLFSVPGEHWSATRSARLGHDGVTGTHYTVAGNPLGPFRKLTDDFLVGDPTGRLYSGKIIQDTNRRWWFLAFHNFGDNGEFIGTIADPLPLVIHGDGRLTVEIGPRSDR